MSQSLVEERVRAYIPMAYLARVEEVIRNAAREAVRRSGEFKHSHPRRNAIWQTRRVLIEEGMIEVGLEYQALMPDRVRVVERFRGNCSVTETHFGPIVLTQYRAGDEDATPRLARYHRDLASDQRPLPFSEFELDPAFPPCHALLLHGGHAAGEIDFLRIIFFDGDLHDTDQEPVKLIPGSFNVLAALAEYREEVQAGRPAEKVVDEAHPELRPGVTPQRQKRKGS
jgi:hypothetical protein